jgi:uncharacterized membrane-anchored protein YitT (DUF2179 family)
MKFVALGLHTMSSGLASIYVSSANITTSDPLFWIVLCCLNISLIAGAVLQRSFVQEKTRV